MSSNDKKRELATNRLLDILRSQQSDIGKQEEAKPKAQNTEEPEIPKEMKTPTGTAGLSLLIPDPDRFGPRPEKKETSEPELPEPEAPIPGSAFDDPGKSGSIADEVKPPLVEEESERSQPQGVEKHAEPSSLEDSPGLNALRKKLGIIKNQVEEKFEDKRPVDIFKTEIKPDTTGETPAHISPTIKDLLKSQKEASTGQPPEDTLPESDSEAEGGKPLFGSKTKALSDQDEIERKEKGKPLSEFFKRGALSDESIDDQFTEGGITAPSILSDQQGKRIQKEAQPLSEFFKKGTQPDESGSDETLIGITKTPIKETKEPRKVMITSDQGGIIDEPPGMDEPQFPQMKKVTGKKPAIEPLSDEFPQPEGGVEGEEAVQDKKIGKTVKRDKVRIKKPFLSFRLLKKKSTQVEQSGIDEFEVSETEKSGVNIAGEDEGTIINIGPESFNDALISFLEVEDYQSTSTDYINTFIHRFDESLQKLAIVTDEQTLLLLLVTIGINGITIDNYKYYTLPYRVNDRVIKNPEDLLGYVLAHELTEKQKQLLYGTYFSTKIQSKTQILQSPELNRKELADLVDWNSTKNLPFPVEHSISNWEITKTEDKSKKREIVIGVIDGKSINSIHNTFIRNKVKLRFTTTLPILLWKAFVKNYPDRRNQCNVIIHMGEIHTIVLVISNHRLLFVREIALGTQDFYKSIMQKIETKDKSTIDIDFEMARQITHQYGFPKDTKGYTVGSKVNLYRLAIFQRPVVERVSGELGRSLNYFKKQNPELVWEELVFDGIGATLPNLVETLRDNLNIDVCVLNPIRTVKVHYSKLSPIPKYLLPNFAVNFALVSEEVRKLNLMPKTIRSDYKNILFSKLAGIAAGIFVPFVAISTFLSALNIDTYTDRIKTLEMERNNTIAQTKEYFDIKGDIEIIQALQNFIANDRMSSDAKIKILKVFSNSVPDEIRITELLFKKRYPGTSSNESFDRFSVRPEYFIELTGFVLSDVSIANIQLANFRVSLQNKSYFKDIVVLRQDISTSASGKLLFTMELKY